MESRLSKEEILKIPAGIGDLSALDLLLFRIGYYFSEKSFSLNFQIGEIFDIEARTIQYAAGKDLPTQFPNLIFDLINGAFSGEDGFKAFKEGFVDWLMSLKTDEEIHSVLNLGKIIKNYKEGGTTEEQKKHLDLLEHLAKIFVTDATTWKEKDSKDFMKALSEANLKPVKSSAEFDSHMPADQSLSINTQASTDALISELQQVLPDSTIGIPCIVSPTLSEKIFWANAKGFFWDFDDIYNDKELTQGDRLMIDHLKTIKKSNPNINIQFLPIMTASLSPGTEHLDILGITLDEIEQFVHLGGELFKPGGDIVYLGNTDLISGKKNWSRIKSTLDNIIPVQNKLDLANKDDGGDLDLRDDNTDFDSSTLQIKLKGLPKQYETIKKRWQKIQRDNMPSKDFERSIRAEFHALKYHTGGVGLSHNVKTRRIRQTVFPVTWVDKSAEAFKSILNTIKQQVGYNKPVQTDLRATTDKLAYRLLEYVNDEHNNAHQTGFFGSKPIILDPVYKQNLEKVGELAHTILHAKCKLDLTKVVMKINEMLESIYHQNKKTKGDYRLFHLLERTREDVNYYKFNHPLSVTPQVFEDVKFNVEKIKQEFDGEKNKQALELCNHIITSGNDNTNKTTRLCALSRSLSISKNKENRELAKRLQGKFLTAEVIEACDHFSFRYQIQSVLTRLVEVKTNYGDEQRDLKVQLMNLLNFEPEKTEEELQQDLFQHINSTLKKLKTPFSSRLRNFLNDVKKDVKKNVEETIPKPSSKEKESLKKV